jgi:protease-4
MKDIIVRILAIIGALVVLVFVVGVLVSGVRGKGRVPAKTVLELDLETNLVEDIPDDPVAKAMLSKTAVVRDVVNALDRAGDDKRVAGLVAHFGSSSLQLGKIQEIRDAVLRFRGKKKFAVAFSDGFGGDDGPGTGPYYLASAFDQIYLQPSGNVDLTGIIIETPFVKGTLDKLGTRFRGDHRYEYKTAFNTLTETRYTPAHKEANEKLLHSWYAQMVKGISEGRHIPEDQVRAWIDRAPLLGKEAEDAKLVDGLKYRDEVYDLVKKKAGDGAELLYASKYLERAGPAHTKGKIIALVYGVGGVVRGKSSYDPLMGNQTMGADTVVGALRAAAQDKNVKAILFRVDSPGGSYVASDTVWREVVRVRQQGKPVIVSMGDVAGSGGYFVSMAADKIVAQPGTITASIGVLSGKLLTSGLWNKVGISWDEVHDGANATIFTGTHDFTPAEWQRFESGLDRVYDDFTTKVAEGRKLPKEKVLPIAKGRIWSGEDAKALGLIDELGGFDTALKLAKKAANIPESEDVNLKLYPKKKGPLQALFGRGADNSEKEGSAAVLTRMLEIIQPLARELQILTGAKQGILSMPEGGLAH